MPERTKLLDGTSATEYNALPAQSADKIYDGYFPFLANLEDQFGRKFLVMLFITQGLVKGFCASFIALGPPTEFLYASYNVPGPVMQIYGAVIQIPWVVKPVIGLITDLFPILGYRKTPYMMMTCLAGSLACASIGFLPQSHLPITGVVICLCAIHMERSTCDLLTEAKYAEEMQRKPAHGPDLICFVQYCQQGGGLCATLTVGLVLQNLGVKVPYIIGLLPMACVMFPLANNYMEETVLTSEEIAAIRQRFFQQTEVCILCLLMLIASVVLTLLGIQNESILWNALGAVAVALVLLFAFCLFLKPIIAKYLAYTLIKMLMTFSVTGPSFYFFTDGVDQYPEGPHFSTFFYTSVLGVLPHLFFFVGIWLYQNYLRNWTYRGIIVTTTIVGGILSCSDLLIFTRLNVKLGIPDHAFVLGSNSLENVVSALASIPGVVLMSHLCPKGMEATMYAILASVNNLGVNISGNLGALMLEWFDVNPSGAYNETQQFDNLWIVKAISIFLPMWPLVLVPFLIPDAHQTDELVEEQRIDATEGSVWRTWFQPEKKESV